MPGRDLGPSPIRNSEFTPPHESLSSEIRNHGRKVIKFRGNDFRKEAAQHRVFTRRA